MFCSLAGLNPESIKTTLDELARAVKGIIKSATPSNCTLFFISLRPTEQFPSGIRWLYPSIALPM